MRETYLCRVCRSSLRYREQANAILKYYAPEGIKNISELAETEAFKALCVYEPGVSGPFRKHFMDLPNYHQSFFWEGVKLGKKRDGVECQDLMRLTYDDDSFDLVITSDILEHVRKPELAFHEIRRVLRPGGRHIFSIPLTWPMPANSISRVDTSTGEDVFLMTPHYHGDGKGGRSLVYTDFGADLLARLAEMDFPTEALRGQVEHDNLSSVLTFVSRKPLLSV